MQSVVLTEGLTKKFGRTKAVLELDLSVEEAETFAIVGREDSGKSTVLHLLMNLVAPTAGRAQVLGYDTATATYQVHRVVGYVPAKLVPPPRLTIEQWLNRARSFRRSEIDKSIRHRVIPQLDAALTDSLAGLTQSELGIVAMVGALQKIPELLMLDEALITMRAQHDLLLDLLEEYKGNGGTVLMTTRDLDAAGEVADKIGLLDAGSLVATGNLGDLRERGRKRLEFVFDRDQRPDLFSTNPAVVGAVVQGRVARVLVHGMTDPVVDYARRNGATEVTSHEAGIEELIADLSVAELAS